MDYIDYLRALRASWWMVALGTLLGAGLAVGAVASATPEYETTTQVFVSTTGTSDVASAIQGNEFSRQRMASYAELLTGKGLATAVIDRLDLDMSTGQFRSQIHAQPVSGTVLLNVTVTDESPRRALAIAQAITIEFADQVERLETPPGAAASPITVTTVATPDLPTEPISPNRMRMLAVGVALGLLLGVGGAVLRSRLDNSVKDDESAARAAGVPVIGHVGQDRELAASHTVQWHSSSPAAEAFRQLRTNLQFLRPDNPARMIMVSSAVPSEGKTTVAVNLALALAQSGRRVVLVEADLRRPRVARYLGLVGGVGLTNVLTGQAKLDDVLQPQGDGRLVVLGAGPSAPNPGELLASSAMVTLLEELSAQSDYVVINVPPVLPVADAVGLAPLVDGTLLCCRYGETTSHQLAQSRAALDQVGATTLGVVLTMMAPKALRGSGTGHGYAEDVREPGSGRRRVLRRRSGTTPVTPAAPEGVLSGPGPAPAPAAGRRGR